MKCTLRYFSLQSALILVSLLFLTACGSNDGPKVTYGGEDAPPAELAKDSTVLEVADIPVYIDSMEYLIHPIGEYRSYSSRKKMYSGSSGYNSGSFKIASYHGFDIKGNLHNIKFQEIGSDNLAPLTEKNIRIKTVSFLREIFDNNKKRFIAYRVIDMDTNRDNELTDNDVEALYVSKGDGSEFKKITEEAHELINWKVVKIENRLYFRTIEDTNENGRFNKYDQMHYYYVDFDQDEWEVVEYRPI